MRLIHQLAQFRERTKMFFDAVEIHCAVTVIIGNLSPRAIRLIGILLAFIQMIDIVIPRCQPNRRYAEILQIGQMLDNAFKVAAVVIARF